MSKPSIPENTNDFVDLARYDNTEISVTKDEDDSILGRSVKLYDTKIAEIRWDRGYLRLYHGGWMTSLTRRRINEFLDVVDATYYVRKVDGNWHLFDERDDKVVASFNGEESLTFWI